MPQPGNRGGEGFSWFYVELTSGPAYMPGDGGRGKSWFVVELTSEPVYLAGDGGLGKSWFVVELTTDPVYDGISPRSIRRTSRVGTPDVEFQRTDIDVYAIAPTTQFGTPAFGTTQWITASGIAPTSNVGTPDFDTDQRLAPTSIESTAEVGTPEFEARYTITASGIEPTTEIGTASLQYNQAIAPNSIEPTSNIGYINVELLRQFVGPFGIAPTAQIGALSLELLRQFITASGIAPATEIGNAAVSFDQQIDTASIAPTSHVGSPSLTGGEEPPQPQPAGVGGGSPGFTSGPIVGQDFEQKWSAEFDTRLPVLNLAQVSGTTALVRVVTYSTSASVSASRNVVFKAQGTRLKASRWNKLINEDEELLLSI